MNDWESDKALYADVTDPNRRLLKEVELLRKELAEFRGKRQQAPSNAYKRTTHNAYDFDEETGMFSYGIGFVREDVKAQSHKPKQQEVHDDGNVLQKLDAILNRLDVLERRVDTLFCRINK